MSLPELVSDVYQIVLRGDFRPITISPTWLRERDLIGDPELEQSAIEILIPNEISVFNAGWLRCQATQDNLTLQTDQQPEVERLRDLAIGILLLPEGRTVSLLGINRLTHFTVANIEQWHSVGDHVVHNELWDGILNISGMRAAVYWGQRSDKYAGRIQVQVEPSFSVRFGIFVSYNDHYELTTVASQPTTRSELAAINRPENTEATAEKIAVAIEVLTGQWEASSELSTRVLERIAEQAGK